MEDKLNNIILVPTDFSEATENATNQAAEAAVSFKYEVKLLHVIDKNTKAFLKHENLQISKLKLLEARKQYINFYKENPDALVKNAVFGFLEKTKQPQTIIFADPPYDFDVDTFSKIPNIVFKNNLLKQNGLLIVEHSKHTNLSHLNHFLYSRIYGGNMFSFFKDMEE